VVRKSATFQSLAVGGRHHMRHSDHLRNNQTEKDARSEMLPPHELERAGHPVLLDFPVRVVFDKRSRVRRVGV
jgi:hypothetical protein